MIYSYDITTPANTPESAPIVTLCRLPRGRAANVDVLFPPGCAGLAHIQIYRGLHQLWPGNAGASIVGDGITVSWVEDYMMLDEPLTLVAFTWNIDDTYPHTITLRVNMLDTDTFRAGNIGDLTPADLV